MMRFSIYRNSVENSTGENILQVGVNLFTGEKDFESSFGALTAIESDLLLIASSIFAADRASKRGEREDLCRNFELQIPVTNFEKLLPLVPQIEKILRLLSNDSWQIRLRHDSGTTQDHEISDCSCQGKTLLFSGGLDSLAAAVEFGKETEILQLVSHKTRNTVTDNCQKRLAALLKGEGYQIQHQQFFVSSADGGPTKLSHAEENSQRTRSFVFLVLGALVAYRTRHYEIIYLAENGQMAIHLPLTSGRIGAFSTHTAHPDVLSNMEQFLASALQAPITIRNPYVHRTKKEVVEIIAQHLPMSIPISTSCWRNSRISAGFTHCGACVPCYIRRIAIEAITTDSTAYARDVWNEDIRRLAPEDDGRRNLLDLVEFIQFFEDATDEEIMSEYPELYSRNISPSDVIDMYRRFAFEARNLFNHYPAVKELLS